MQNVSKSILDLIETPKADIEAKIDEYFTANGFKNPDEVTDHLFYGMDKGKDFCYFVEGSFDGVKVEVRYEGFKPERLVRRDILALDDRIDSVNITRDFPQEAYDTELDKAQLDTIFVLIDGKLQQTTIMEYVQYKMRNMTFKK